MIIRREYPKEKAIGKNGSITSTKGGERWKDAVDVTD